MNETTLPNHDFWPLQGARMVPVDLIQPGRYQPRKRFAEVPLKELAESIKQHGIMQPVLLRIMPGGRFELVAGERRWRAAKMAFVEEIPAVARELTLMQVLELQAIENTQREDLHPLEEADSYALLHTPPESQEGLSIELIAERVSKSVAHVRKRISLCKLIPDARDAFFEDVINLQTAHALARLPVHVQATKWPKVLATRANDKPVAHKDAEAVLADVLQLRLNTAPFPIKDATLIPAAGGCNHCPKRTGANPDLFSDVPDDDTCTDPECHSGKHTAHNERRKVEARAAGLQVIEGDAARALLKFGQSSDALNGDYVYMDQALEDLTGSKSSLSKLLGTNLVASALFEHPLQRTLREIVTTAKAMDTLKAHSLLAIKPDKQIKQATKAQPEQDNGSTVAWPFPGEKEKRSPIPPQTNVVPDEVWAQERQWRVQLFEMVHKAFHDKGYQPVLPAKRAAAVELGEAFLDDAENWALMCRLWGWEEDADWLASDSLRDRLVMLTAPMEHDSIDLLIAELALMADLDPDSHAMQDPRLPGAHMGVESLPLMRTAIDPDLDDTPIDWRALMREAFPMPVSKRSSKVVVSKPQSTPPRDAPAQGEQNSAQAEGAYADASTQEDQEQAPSAQGLEGQSDKPHWVGLVVQVKGAKRLWKVEAVDEANDLRLKPIDGKAGSKVVAWTQVVVMPGQQATAEANTDEAEA